MFYGIELIQAGSSLITLIFEIIGSGPDQKNIALDKFTSDNLFCAHIKISQNKPENRLQGIVGYIIVRYHVDRDRHARKKDGESD